MVQLLLLAVLAPGPLLTPTDLRCESLHNPVGIANAQPALSWKLVAPKGAKNVSQTKFRILVSDSVRALAEDRGNLWDSGERTSAETAFLPYSGQALSSRAECWWKVKVWDQNGVPSGWSQPARWSVGLVQPSDWVAEWIGFDEPRKQAQGRDPLEGSKWIWGKKGVKTLTTRRTLTLADAPKSATLHITVDDHFQARVNGATVGASDRAIDSWRKPKSFPIASAFKKGQNVIEIDAEDTGGDAGIVAAIHMVYSTGASEFIRTDKNWEVNSEPATEVANYGSAPWGSPARQPILPPARYLRKNLYLDKKIKRAIVYATAQGIFELNLNGQKVSDEYFMPGWSNYEKRTYVRAYDVTTRLKTGPNAIGAILADGWFSGYVGYGGQRDHYGPNLRFAAQLEVSFADGTQTIVYTDRSWRGSTGPILFSDFLAGESYDARAELTGWDQPSFSDAGWFPVDTGSTFKTTLEPFPGQPVRAIAEFKAKKVTETQPGVYVVDLGQNIAGFARIKVQGKAGQRITLRFAERLNLDGTVYVTNLRGAKATDTYICRGSGTETWSPKFTFHGFQFIEVSGLERAPAPGDIVGVAISSDTPIVGTIETSDPMINQLVSNALWTQRMNFIDIPTDCPQRDERLGWTGDAQAYIRTSAMFADVHPFFSKWLVSLEDSQRADGQFPMVAPLKVAEGDGGPAWADAGVICPWEMYDIYGDKRFLSRHYPSMKKFVEFCRARSTPDLLPPNQFHCFGDWLNINDNTPNEVIYSAYFAGSTRLLAKAATEMGNVADAAEYEALYQQLRKVFQKTYVSPDGRVRGDSQTAYVLALAFDLLDMPQVQMAAGHLVRRIQEKNGHLSTGFVGTRDIMHVLSKIGRNDIAFKLLHNKTFPSWGFTIENGATSIWERWDGWTPDRGFQDPGMNSFAHYAFGAVVGWIFAQPGGITSVEPGFKSVLIAPEMDPNLKWMRTRYDSVRGPITVNWDVRGKSPLLHVEIPPNVGAEVRWQGKTHRIGSGSYDFE